MENESVDRIEKAEGAGEQEVKTGPGDGGLPIKDYDGLNVQKATAQLDSLSREDLERIKSYEQEHKNRKTLIAEMDKRLAAGEQQETIVEEPDKMQVAEERQQTPLEEPYKEPVAEEQQEAGTNTSWFSTYRNWILAAVGALVILWLIF